MHFHAVKVTRHLKTYQLKFTTSKITKLIHQDPLFIVVRIPPVLIWYVDAIFIKGVRKTRIWKLDFLYTINHLI